MNKGKRDGDGGGRKEGKRCKRGLYTTGRENRKEKKGQVAHVKLDRRDGTAPRIEGYISPPNGEDKRDNKEGEGTTVSTVRGVRQSCCSWSRQPGSLYHPHPYRFPRRGPGSHRHLIHHYPIPPSRFFSHVHIFLEPPPELLPRRISQSSCQSQPRRYRQVVHPVRCKFRRRHVPLS